MSSSCGGRDVPRTSARWPSCARRWTRSVWTRRRSRCVTSAPRRMRSAQRFVGSPTIRVDGRDIQPPDDEPVGLTCRVYRLRDGRVSPTPDPADLRDALMAATKGGVTMAEPFDRRRRHRRSSSLTPRAPRIPWRRGGQPTAVVFTCNHCPYALAWHDRILDVAREYEDRGVRFAADQPQRRGALSARLLRGDAEARARRRRLAGSLPATTRRRRSRTPTAPRPRRTCSWSTPTATLRYRGAPDADYNDPGQNAEWLRGALDAVLEGGDPDPAETDPVGCSMKWK